MADDTACSIDELDEKGRGHCPHSLVETSGGECRLLAMLRPAHNPTTSPADPKEH